jgi:hypothetical protein
MPYNLNSYNKLDIVNELIIELTSAHDKKALEKGKSIARTFMTLAKKTKGSKIVFEVGL